MKNKIKFLTNTEDKKRLMSNFFSLSVLRGFQFLIPLITLPYIVRTIGIENFGLLSFAMSLGVYFQSFIQYGFSVTATREIARNREDIQKVSQIFYKTFLASLFLTIFSFLIYLIILFSFEKFNQHFELYLLVFAVISSQSLFPIWFFQGMEKMKFITFFHLTTSIVFLLLLVPLVKTVDDFIFIPLLQSVIALIMLGLSFFVIHKKFGIEYTCINIQQIKQTLIHGKDVFISSFFLNLYTNTPMFLLGMVANNTTVGLFAAAVKLIDAAGSIAYVFSNTFLPYLSRGLSKHLFFQKIMISVGLLIMIFTILFADYIVTVMYGEGKELVAFYLQLLSIGVPLIFIQLTYGTNYLNLIGKDDLVRKIVVNVSILSLLYSVLLIYIFSVWGAIFTLVFTRVLLSSSYFLSYLKAKKDL
jgi:PST family polysaccharide transporter